MAYAKQVWTDGSDGGTPINAIRLKHIEDGIGAVDSALSSVVPGWVLSTLKATLDTLAHPMVMMVVYSSGWTINAALQTDANVAWHFVGGTSATPPPTTTGPQVWDHS